jgi:hypothetical protein
LRARVGHRDGGDLEGDVGQGVPEVLGRLYTEVRPVSLLVSWQVIEPALVDVIVLLGGARDEAHIGEGQGREAHVPGGGDEVTITTSELGEGRHNYPVYTHVNSVGRGDEGTVQVHRDR